MGCAPGSAVAWGMGTPAPLAGRTCLRSCAAPGRLRWPLPGWKESCCNFSPCCGLRLWGPTCGIFLDPWESARSGGELGFSVCFGGLVLLSRTRSAFLGSWAGGWGSRAGDAASAPRVHWVAVSWFLRNPVVVAGYSQPRFPPPSPRSRGLNFAAEPWILNWPRGSRGRPEAFFKLRNLAFSPFCCRLFSFKASAGTL